MKQYKFKIQYTLEKNNDKANALNRQSDHMKSKRIFDHSILKINKNKSLSINTNEINATLRILKDDEKQYFVVKEKLQILKDKINDTIKKHHDESLCEHSDVNKTL